MLKPCPECGTQVSEKAPTCPKCGAIITHPPFYTTVERDGLNISSLLCDWWSENLDDSALGGNSIQLLCHHSDDEKLVDLTIKNGPRLIDAMRNRLMELPKNSAEAATLSMTIEYVHAARDFAIVVRGCCQDEPRWNADKLKSNIKLILQRLEKIKSGCSETEDLKLIITEIDNCTAFAAKLQGSGAGSPTKGSSASPSALPRTQSSKSGCLTLLIVFLAVTLGFVGAVFAFTR